MLEGKVAVVTGGSRGIGLGIVTELIEQHATVYYLSRSQAESHDQLEHTADEHGTAVRWWETDIADEKQNGAAFAEILAETDRVDLLVNNAGITRDGLVFRLSLADWEEVIKVNLTAMFLSCRNVSRAMIKARTGSIVNIGSVVGLGGNAGQTNYAASKAGIVGFSRSLAREVASRGVRVNVVAPGYIDTDMTQALGEKARDTIIAMIPLGRTGTVADVAGLVAFLGSDRSTYITGQVLGVDGGLAM